MKCLLKEERKTKLVAALPKSGFQSKTNIYFCIMSGQVCKDLIFVIVIFQNTRGAFEALIGGLVTSKFSTITTVYLELMMLCRLSGTS